MQPYVSLTARQRLCRHHRNRLRPIARLVHIGFGEACLERLGDDLLGTSDQFGFGVKMRAMREFQKQAELQIVGGSVYDLPLG